MKLWAKVAGLAALGLLAACSDADVASQNLSTDADNFKIERRIVFFNSITNTYMATITGLCSLGNNDPIKQLSVTCKVGPDSYKKSFLGLSDNVTYFVEQIDPATVDVYHYEIVWKPETVIPTINLR